MPALPESLRRAIAAHGAGLGRHMRPAPKPLPLRVVERGVDETVIYSDGRIFKNGKLLKSKA